MIITHTCNPSLLCYVAKQQLVCSESLDYQTKQKYIHLQQENYNFKRRSGNEARKWSGNEVWDEAKSGLGMRSGNEARNDLRMRLGMAWEWG